MHGIGNENVMAFFTLNIQLYIYNESLSIINLNEYTLFSNIAIIF